MQMDALNENNSTTTSETISNKTNKYSVYGYSSMSIKPYYHSRLRALARLERRDMVSYFEEWADDFFQRRKATLKKLGMEVATRN